MAGPHEQSDVPQPWQPKFGLAGLLMVMFVCSVMAAGGYYFVQYLRGGRQSQLAFILFTLASPMLLMVVVSAMRAVYRLSTENKKVVRKNKQRF